MIIVFGSNVLDQFFDLAELPGRDQAVHVDSHIEAPGGKGANQAVAAARAGTPVRFFGAVGEGGHGRQLIKNLQENDINTSGIQIVEKPTSVAAIFVDHADGTHRIVVSQGANTEANQADITDNLLTRDTTLLLQAELNLNETQKLIRRARERNCKSVIVNLAPYKPLADEMLRDINILIMNEHEASSLRDHLGHKDAGFEDFARKLHASHGLTPVITLGPDGAIAFDGATLHRVPSLPVKAVDAVGAGDAFSGYLAAFIDKGYGLAESLRYASVAGSITCTRVGAQSALPQLREVEAHVMQLGKSIEQAA